MRRVILSIIVLATALAGLAHGGSMGRAEQSEEVHPAPGEAHLPDLLTRTPEDLVIQREGGQRVLRFSNTIYNFGYGPLELRPENQPRGGTVAYQRIFTHDTNGNSVLFSETQVGIFTFHRAHHHWHFDNFAGYTIHYDAAGAPGSVALATSKTTVCIRDNRSPESGGNTLEHFGWGGYTRCTKTATEGLSVGYGDTYTWDIAGQDINIETLADGCYWLVSTADPYGLLAESNDGNNAAAIQFSFSGDSLTKVGGC